MPGASPAPRCDLPRRYARLRQKCLQALICTVVSQAFQYVLGNDTLQNLEGPRIRCASPGLLASVLDPVLWKADVLRKGPADLDVVCRLFRILSARMTRRSDCQGMRCIGGLREC